MLRVVDQPRVVNIDAIAIERLAVFAAANAEDRVRSATTFVGADPVPIDDDIVCGHG